MVERTCCACGSSIEHRQKTAKYCSEACRRWVLNGHTEPRRPNTHCAFCGAPFSGKLVTARYCTRKCKLAASEKRRVRDDHARYLKERERRIANAIEYARRNPHVGQAAKRKRKALLAQAGVFDFSGREWERCKRRFGGRCAYCGVVATLTMDHVIPVSRGGAHSAGNIVPACASCNCRKKHRTVMEWRTGKSVTLAA